MRQRILKIDGKEIVFTLLGGISGKVKIYHASGYKTPWLFIGSQKFTVQQELANLVMNYVNLKYQPKENQEAIEKEFKNLIEIYRK